MVFGWFLNNIITSNPGSVKFSVRFFSTIEETDDQNEEVLKLNFSLSTKTQTITINPAIVYDINSESGLPEVNAYNDLHLVTNRFVDSVNPGGTGSAEEPVFTHPEFGGIFGEDLQPVATIPIYDSKNETIIDRIHVADLNDITNQLTLLTEAEATDAGKISYYWREKRLERENSTRMTPGPSYIKTEDVEVQEGKKYFIKVSINGVNSSYSEAVGLEVGEAFPEGEYYEQYNGITVSQTGDYWVEAKNRHGSAIAIKKSEIIRIPGPETLSVEAPDLEGNFLDEEGNISIKAVGTTPQENDIINYSWVDAKGVKLKEDDVELNAGFDNEGYSQNIGSILEMATIPAEEIAGYDKNIQVVVSAERNGAVTLPITKSFRITGMPQPAEVVPRNALISTNLTNPVDLYVDINAPKVCDMLTYQWFKYTSDEEDSDFLIEGASGEVENGSAKYSIAYGPNAEQGTFYCRVTTEVNGGSTYVDSDHIVVSRA